MAYFMEFSIHDELQPIAEELQRHMSPRVLEHLAKEKGFVQRKSKYQEKELVALCVWQPTGCKYITHSIMQLS